jgi:hypothetical protein
MTGDNSNEVPGPLAPRIVDVPFLLTASELRDRKYKRRRKRLVELGLKVKGE